MCKIQEMIFSGIGKDHVYTKLFLFELQYWVTFFFFLILIRIIFLSVFKIKTAVCVLKWFTEHFLLCLVWKYGWPVQSGNENHVFSTSSHSLWRGKLLEFLL